jgi:hypothetical protein
MLLLEHIDGSKQVGDTQISSTEILEGQEATRGHDGNEAEPANSATATIK